MPSLPLEIKLVDYDDENQTQALLALLDHYANDPMGGGTPLSKTTQANLIPQLKSYPQVFSLLCYHQDRAIGLANCIESFSTFSAKPVINIHDIVVLSAFRGAGVGKRLLSAIEEIARTKGCAKLTLEVLEGNPIAQKVYANFGFEGYALQPSTGQA